LFVEGQDVDYGARCVQRDENGKDDQERFSPFTVFFGFRRFNLKNNKGREKRRKGQADADSRFLGYSHVFGDEKIYLYDEHVYVKFEHVHGKKINGGKYQKSPNRDGDDEFCETVEGEG
jgi:hypothetical protein